MSKKMKRQKPINYDLIEATDAKVKLKDIMKRINNFDSEHEGEQLTAEEEIEKQELWNEKRRQVARSNMF